MAISRLFILMFMLGFTSASFARVDADNEASEAIAQLEAAQLAYQLALEQVNIAESNLTSARERAIALGLIPTPAEAAIAIQPETPAESSAENLAAPKPNTPSVDVPNEVKEEVKKVDKGPSFWDGWKRSVRVGINATSGNTENSNLNLQFNTTRKNKKYLTKFDSEYRFATQNGEDTQNRLDIDFRHEWLAQGDSKVGWWVTASAEFDEFQDWDYRLSAHAGISYQFIKNDKTQLKARTGFGGSQTFGGTNDLFRPEALVTGIEMRHKFNDTMNITAATEYFVDVSEVTRDRLNNNVKLNILLDKESNMNLQFKLTHKYDSQPGGNNDNNDLYFDITVGWQF